ncbi:MAG: hypothetical protein M5R36_29930 [Deltaproteobacteria bacterium]|nr:hypothetical protein [Deltaproteobacteria bacterium]
MIDWVGAELPEPASPVGFYGTPEERNTDNLWMLQPDAYHENNKRTYDKVTIDAADPHFQTLELVSRLGPETQGPDPLLCDSLEPNGQRQIPIFYVGAFG